MEFPESPSELLAPDPLSDVTAIMDSPVGDSDPPNRLWIGVCLGTCGLVGLSLLLQARGLGFLATLALVGILIWRLVQDLRPLLIRIWRSQQLEELVVWLGLISAAVGILAFSGITDPVVNWLSTPDWNAIGALGEVFGAGGQILIAVLAAYIAWRQYIISRDLTIQQNLITQQQTIDAYFQGISDLVLDPEGQLDDWPLERAIAEGRTAAILNGVDRVGKAKILRFLSTANLLSPLRRDDHLGRPILDGSGGYQRDRARGIRVVHLRSMLEKADLHGTEIPGLDLSDTSLELANLSDCDLRYVNFCRADLRGAKVQRADLYKALLFVGDPLTASPFAPGRKSNFKSGQGTGAILEGADFRGVQHLSPEQRCYLCAWGGSITRATIPGGCRGIPDRLTGSTSSS